MSAAWIATQLTAVVGARLCVVTKVPRTGDASPDWGWEVWDSTNGATSCGECVEFGYVDTLEEAQAAALKVAAS